VAPLPVNEGRVELEWRRPLVKLVECDPARCEQRRAIDRPDRHPLCYL